MSMTETPAQHRETDESHKEGRVVSIAGPVVDVEFPPGDIPEINTALVMTVELEGQTIDITSEVAQQPFRLLYGIVDGVLAAARSQSGIAEVLQTRLSEYRETITANVSPLASWMLSRAGRRSTCVLNVGNQFNVLCSIIT